ncbi:MAG: transporter [Bacilli bacterium]|nr:transporter [Bacilli bacterium]
MIYIKKYYRKAILIIGPLIILIVIIYLIGIKNKAPTIDTLDELLINSNDNLQISSNNTKVNIKGAVVNPGVYSFENGERVIDAIEKSGGLLETADTSVINLSKSLFDEMVIIIYTYDEVQAMKGNNVLVQYVEHECNCPKLENDACLVKDNESNNNVSNGNFSINQKISLNTATIDQLQTLSGIGESKAKAIIKYREEYGNFTKIEDIMNVTGIGEKVFEQIKDNITI